jgi:hypothetical protein
LKRAGDGHNRGVTLRPSSVLLAAALLLAAAVSGCDAVSQDLSCPGDGCSSGLAGVRARVADVPGVIEVTSVEYRYGLDTGHRGRVVYRATPKDAAAARDLNRSVLEVVRRPGSDLAEATDVDLQLVWSPETLVPRTDELGTAATRTAVPADDCARSGCRKQLRQVEHEVGPRLPTGFRLAEVRLDERGLGGPPDVVVRLVTDLRMTELAHLKRVSAQVSVVLAKAPVPAAYGERVLVTHPVEHTMLTRWTSYDGFTDVPDQQAVDH